VISKARALGTNGKQGKVSSLSIQDSLFRVLGLLIPLICILFYSHNDIFGKEKVVIQLQNSTTAINYCKVQQNLRLYEIPSELGAGTRGSSLGIQALKTASIGSQSNFFACLPSTKIKTENKVLFTPVNHKFAKRIPSIYTMWQRNSAAMKNAFEESTFPIILTGDHSNAGGLISGVKMAYPEKRIGVIWIDAHADIHSPYTTPSGNVHGMPIAALLNDDNMDKQRNKLDQETKSLWDNMKNLGNIRPKISAQDIVYIAVRDTEEEEDHMIESRHIKKITVDTLRQRGIQSIVKEVLEYLEVDLIYVSFDVDSMDPTLSQGTGTPVAHGLTNIEAETLLKGIVQDSRVKAFEITEINPTLDSENKMAKNTFKILDSVAETIHQRL